MRLLREPIEVNQTPLIIKKDRRPLLHRILRKGTPQLVLETPFIDKEQFQTILIEQLHTSIFEQDRLILGVKVEAILIDGYMIFGLEPLKQKNNVFECRYDYYRII